jgi:putative methionine-R-sulfoxide reductase with GAF domain
MENTAGFIPGSAEARLENIRSLTDSALAYMSVEELLGELLDRVREIMSVDTAVVLLLDDSRRHLVATAARGLQEEVNQDVRIPVSKGFSGRVAAERQPVIIDDITDAQIVSAQLVARGLRSLLGVPLVAEGTLLGVLHVGTERPHHFTDSEVELLRLAADRAALAARTMLSEAERTAALELQRSLVPSTLPEIPGIELATRYSPGQADVGGDWYDVFTLPTGEIGVVMGDVTGHGLQAAIIMGRMRSALRSYALESADPATVLGKLDRKMQHFEPGAMGTVLYAVCDPAMSQAKISSAGHLPPVLGVPGRPSASLEADIVPDLMIGVDTDMTRHTTTVPIPPAGILCLYTDGLVERRGSTLDTGIGKLCAAIEDDGPLEKMCASIMAALISREPISDDVALLVLRRRHPDEAAPPPVNPIDP